MKLPLPRATRTRNSNSRLALPLAIILHSSFLIPNYSALHAAVPLRWTVETSRAQPAQFEAYQGETLDLEAALTSHGKPLQAPLNYSLYWQTNGMGAVYWSTNCATGAGATNVMRATWRPEYDVGAKAYNCFIGAPGDIYHAAFQLRLRPSPGASPSELPLPTPTIDFARVTVLNPPWPTNDLTSVVASNAAAIASNAAAVASNAAAIATNAADIASHLADTSNPHRVTAEQVGALPITGGRIQEEEGSVRNATIYTPSAVQVLYHRPVMGGTKISSLFYDRIETEFESDPPHASSYLCEFYFPSKSGTFALTSDIPPPPGDYAAVSNAAMTAHRDATNYTDAATADAIRSAENYTDSVLDSAAYFPKYYFKGGRWYRQDLVDRAADDITLTLERYGDDVFVWFEAVDGPATVTLTNRKSSAVAPKFERLKDGAWAPFSFPVALAAGERVMFRTQYGVTNAAYFKSDSENWKFGGSGKYAVGGNAAALFVYEGLPECPANALREVFMNNPCVVDVSRLVLPFTELGEACYQQMFHQATNLVRGVHVLPARHVPGSAYLAMFNTTAIDLAPRILAETVGGTYAMANMFINCNGLDHVYLPYLTNTASYATRGFAQNAHNINRIASMFPLEGNVASAWTSGVAERGVLVCPVSVGTQDTIARNTSACPTNWIVENIDAPYVQFTNAYGVPSEVSLLWSSGTVPKLECSTDGGATWTALTLTKGTALRLATLAEYGDRLMVRAQTGKTNVALNGSRFITGGKVDVSGNVMSLVSQSCPAAIPANNMFMGLFGLTSTPADGEAVWDSDGIAASDGLLLPSVDVKAYCYDEMFAHCRRMRYSPLTLPAASLPQRAYCLMFWRCIDMVETPDVLASSATSTLAIRSIFMNCISARRARFPNFANVTQSSTFQWALRCDEWFSHQDVRLEYVETGMEAFKNNSEWVQGLEYTRGLFVCPAALGNRETIRRGDSACPYGWDVINY